MQYWYHKMGPVRFVMEALANGTSQWIITINLGRYAVSCVLGATQDWHASWITFKYFERA